MRIELIWPRPDAADRTLTIVVPDVPTTANDLLRPALRRARQAMPPAVLSRAIGYAEPVLSSAACAAGAGPVVRLAVPWAIRFAQRALAPIPGPRRP